MLTAGPDKVNMKLLLITLLFAIYDRSVAQVRGSGDSRIVGGVDADKGQFKALAAIYFNDGRYACGGSLIAPNVVLTAAHCLIACDKVKVNMHDRQHPDASVESFTVLKKIGHPMYGVQEGELPNNRYDVALLLLDGHSTITPMLLLDDNSESLVTNNASLTAAGFGLTQEGGLSSNILQKVVVYAMENDVCNNMYDWQNIGQTKVTPDMLCAGVPGGGKDACQGDSGGPLMLMDPDGDDTRNVQVGAVSWGYGCARAQFPGVYARLTKITKWIKDTTTWLDPAAVSKLRFYSEDKKETTTTTTTITPSTGTTTTTTIIPSTTTTTITPSTTTTTVSPPSVLPPLKDYNNKIFYHTKCLREFKTLRQHGRCHKIRFTGKAWHERNCEWVMLKPDVRCAADNSRYCCPEECGACEDVVDE